MFQQFKQKQIPVIFVKGAGDGDIESGMQITTWPELVDEMSKFNYVSDKRDAGMFLPVAVKPKQEWVKGESNLLDGKEKTFRNKNNMTHITMAVIDLDEEGSLEQARKKFEGIEYIVHSTFSYNPDTPYKYRMIMPLENPIPADQWPRTFIHLMAGIDGDYSCGNVSRGYYLPSVDVSHNIQGVFLRSEGLMLTQERIIDLAEKNMDGKALEELSKIEKKNEGTSRGEKLHPSGVLIESKYSGTDLSYEGFLKRHKIHVDKHFDGGKGSRHHYAIEVLNREMGIFAGETRFDLVVEFIYRSTLENSTTPLSSGNTGDEIPEIAHSGIAQIMPKDLLRDREFINKATEQIKAGLDNSVEAEKTGRWSFEPIIFEKKRLGNSLKSFRSRYFRELDAFEKMCQDIVDSGQQSPKLLFMKAFNEKVVIPVLNRELTSNTAFDLQSMGRFFLEMMKENNIGHNPVAGYLNLSKKLSPYISGLNVAVVKDQGLTQELVYERLTEVAAISSLVHMVENENKNRFKSGYRRNSSSNVEPSV